MPERPTGTVTFLFTDIEGSTERWEQDPEAMRAALERHDALLRSAIEADSGYVFKTVGEAFCAAFQTAGATLAAAIAAQRAVAGEDWSAFGDGFTPIRVRMAVHTGETREREGDYYGAPVNRVARLETAASGGQILLSAATERLVREQLPEGASLRDLGEHRLKDLRFSEQIFQLVAPGMADVPANLRTAPPLEPENPHGLSLPPGSKAILGRMFSTSARAVLDSELAGGFSGSRVYKVIPYRDADTPELPAVVKIGPAGLVMREFEAYQQHIRGRLSGIPEIWGNPVYDERGHWAGIRYALVGSDLFDIESLASYARRAEVRDVVHVLESRLLVHLGAMWQHHRTVRGRLADRYDALLPVNLALEPLDGDAGQAAFDLRPDTYQNADLARGAVVHVSGFVVTETEPHLQSITLNLPDAADGDTSDSLRPGAYRMGLSPISDVGAYRVGDVIEGPILARVRETRHSRLLHELGSVLATEVDLEAATVMEPAAPAVGDAEAGRPPLPNPVMRLAGLLEAERELNVATVHGDLNMENVLVDPEARTIHLIDFALSREDHVLHDLLRLETAVLTRLVPEALAEAGRPATAIVELVDRLHRQPDAGPTHPALLKPYLMLLTLRRAAVGLLARPGDWSEHYIGLAAYLLGASKYRNLSSPAKRAAFWSSAALLRWAETSPSADVVALDGAMATLLERNPVLEAFRRGRIEEWTGPRWELVDRFVALTLLIDQGEEATSGRWQAKEERYASLETLLAEVETPAVALLGPPGSGKSTILRHLELSTSLGGLDDPETPLTFFIQLNQYKPPRPGDPLPEPGEWLAERWKSRHPELPALPELLAEGRMLLLLDALNEMPAESEAAFRGQVQLWKDWLVRLAGDHPGNHVVFSCRSLDYSQPLSTPALRVPQVRIEGMDDAQVQRFLETYSPARFGEIWSLLEGTPQLEVVRSPFFLKLLVDQVDATGEMPEGRAALFTGFVRQALRREIERGSRLFEPGELLTSRDLRRVSGWKWKTSYDLPERGILLPKLATLARDMQDRREDGGSAQVRIDLDDALDLLDTEADETVVAAGQALSVLDEDEAAEELMYVHQLVQEYFAARELARRPDPELVRVAWRAAEIRPTVEEVIENLAPADPLPGLPQTGWEETTLLAAAIAEDAAGFVRGVMGTNLALAGRAAASAEVHAQLPSELLDELCWALVRRSRDPECDLRDRIACGYAVGVLGDPRYERKVGPYGEYLLPPVTEIQGGVYKIGDARFDSRYIDRVAPHEISVASFCIGQFQVTNAEWQCFVAGGGYGEGCWWDTELGKRWRAGIGTGAATRELITEFVQQTRSNPEIIEHRLSSGRWSQEQYERALERVSMSPDELDAHLLELYPDVKHAAPARWHDRQFNEPAQPVTGISWYEARAYATWLSAQTGLSFDLPSLAEWQVAASGMDSGSCGISRSSIVSCGNFITAKVHRPTPVGVFPLGDANPGVSDLLGNSEEWTSTAYGARRSKSQYSPHYDPTDGRENRDVSTPLFRICFGGSFNDWPHSSAVFYVGHPADRNDVYVGMRLKRLV